MSNAKNKPAKIQLPPKASEELTQLCKLKVRPDGTVIAAERTSPIVDEIIDRLYSILGRVVTIADITAENCQEVLLVAQAEKMQTNSLRYRRDWFAKLNAVAVAKGLASPICFDQVAPLYATAWQANPKIDITANPEATLSNLLSLTIDDSGVVSHRTAGPEVKTDRAVLDAIAELTGRPAEINDIRFHIAESILAKELRTSTYARPRGLRNKLKWFVKYNRIAHAMGWAELIDFTGIPTSREEKFRWSKRGETPKPEVDDSDDSEAKSMQETTLSKLLESQFKRERLAGTSPHTQRLYKYTIRKFSIWLERPAIVADLNTDTVTDHIADLLENTDLSPDTVSKSRSQLVSLWTYCGKKGWLREFPQIRKIKTPERTPDSWSTEETKQLLDACKHQKGSIGNVPADVFWSALLLTVFDTAERIGALLDTERSGLSGEWLTIRAEHRKGGRRDKAFRLRPDTVAKLKELFKYTPMERAVFHWPYSRTYVWKLFDDLLDSAGLPHSRRNKFHKIRRTVASAFEAAGGNATELLDHESRRTTKTSYLDPKVIKSVFPADLLPPPGTEKPAEPESGTENESGNDELKQLLAETLRRLGQ